MRALEKLSGLLGVCGSSVTSAARDHAGELKQKAAEVQRAVPTALKKSNSLSIAKKKHHQTLNGQTQD